MVGILGSGFGLYGYLPAVVAATTKKIVLLENALEKFNSRKEIQFCRDQIIWVKTWNEFIREIDLVILAVPPSAQAPLVEKLLETARIKKFLIEKPIAVTPHQSSILLQKLIHEKKLFLVGYSFLYTGWANFLIDHFKRNKHAASISIRWNFLAHHYKSNLINWKRYHSQGGGALRFYGIHLVALASILGFDNILDSVYYGFSKDDIFKWHAIFRDSNGSKIEIMVDSEPFTIKLADPFEESSAEFGDKRIDLLTKIYQQLEELESNDEMLYSRINQLWLDVEKITYYKLIDYHD